MTKTEVVVRGLYHAYAADLEITLLHQEHSCVLSAATDDDIGGRPSGEQFGIPEDRRYIHGFGSNPGEVLDVYRESEMPMVLSKLRINAAWVSTIHDKVVDTLKRWQARYIGSHQSSLNICHDRQVREQKLSKQGAVDIQKCLDLSKFSTRDGAQDNTW